MPPKIQARVNWENDPHLNVRLLEIIHQNDKYRSTLFPSDRSVGFNNQWIAAKDVCMEVFGSNETWLRAQQRNGLVYKNESGTWKTTEQWSSSTTNPVIPRLRLLKERIEKGYYQEQRKSLKHKFDKKFPYYHTLHELVYPQDDIPMLIPSSPITATRRTSGVRRRSPSIDSASSVEDTPMPNRERLKRRKIEFPTSSPDLHESDLTQQVRELSVTTSPAGEDVAAGQSSVENTKDDDTSEDDDNDADDDDDESEDDGMGSNNDDMKEGDSDDSPQDSEGMSGYKLTGENDGRTHRAIREPTRSPSVQYIPPPERYQKKRILPTASRTSQHPQPLRAKKETQPNEIDPEPAAGTYTDEREDSFSAELQALIRLDGQVKQTVLRDHPVQELLKEWRHGNLPVDYYVTDVMRWHQTASPRYRGRLQMRGKVELALEALSRLTKELRHSTSVLGDYKILIREYFPDDLVWKRLLELVIHLGELKGLVFEAKSRDEPNGGLDQRFNMWTFVKFLHGRYIHVVTGLADKLADAIQAGVSYGVGRDYQVFFGQELNLTTEWALKRCVEGEGFARASNSGASNHVQRIRITLDAVGDEKEAMEHGQPIRYMSPVRFITYLKKLRRKAQKAQTKQEAE
nr:uncharacterized protein CI109_002365 [Kwoniella shandongensis]KAA5529470.1 hypothetical protein CI109_002365 [Kwoniella shandongensis]